MSQRKVSTTHSTAEGVREVLESFKESFVEQNEQKVCSGGAETICLKEARSAAFLEGNVKYFLKKVEKNKNGISEAA